MYNSLAFKWGKNLPIFEISGTKPDSTDLFIIIGICHVISNFINWEINLGYPGLRFHFKEVVNQLISLWAIKRNGKTSNEVYN